MKKFGLFLGMLFMATSAFAQVRTASEFFRTVSDRYASFKDYEADVQVTIGKSNMSGKVSFKRPEMLRIDFTEPKDQVICFDGDTMKIYLPGASAILQQTVSGSSAGTVAGLGLLSRYYTVAYETGQAAVPLESGSSEMVVNLVLWRRSNLETFSQIRISVNPDTHLIRRVIAYQSKGGEVYTFNFTNYRTNVGISEQRFIYDPPSSANNYNNFLFEE